MNPLIDLSGMRVLVTGAGSGIGRASAILASSLGATVALVGRRRERLEETAAMIGDGPQPIVLACDVTDSEALEGTVSAFASGGRIGGLVHAAGICPVAPLSVVGVAGVEKAMRVNCTAFLDLMRRCMKPGRAADGFSAVVVSSVSAEAGWSGGTVYSASKGAVSAAVRSLAVELAPRGCRVNAVCPSSIKTEMYEVRTGLSDDAGTGLAGHPLGIGEPRQVAAAVCFLLSSAASFVTGVNLPVDGGFLAQ